MMEVQLCNMSLHQVDTDPCAPAECYCCTRPLLFEVQLPNAIAALCVPEDVRMTRNPLIQITQKVTRMVTRMITRMGSRTQI
jgi:hypothetical protein